MTNHKHCNRNVSMMTNHKHCNRIVTIMTNHRHCNRIVTIMHLNIGIFLLQIERIQNLDLFRMYAAKRSLLENQNQNVKNEQELWHGTPESAIDSINQYGFNRSYCASNSSKLCLYLLLKKINIVLF